MTVILTAAVRVRADSLPAGQQASPIGFWSFAPAPNGDSSGGSPVISLYDSGHINAFSLAGWTAPNSHDAFANQIIGGGLVIGGSPGATATFTINASDSNGNPLPGPSQQSADLTWTPANVTLTPGYGPLVATWTALTDGTYTVNSSVAPSQMTGSSGSQTITGGTGSTAFSDAISFKAGDSISFTSAGSTGITHFTSFGGTTGTDFNVNFSPFVADPVPEPSPPVALAGFGLMAIIGLAIAAWRRRNLTAVDCH